MSYEENIKKIETIINELESGEAVSMDIYQEKAKEAKRLIAECRKQIMGIEEELKNIPPQEK